MCKQLEGTEVRVSLVRGVLLALITLNSLSLAKMFSFSVIHRL
jgi:hypothetical protein